MRDRILFSMPGNNHMTAVLGAHLQAHVGTLAVRQFPDGETYLRYGEGIAGHDVTLVCTLDQPDGKLIRLLFAARAARELGAQRIGLVAPYLAYMRQDCRFHSGEAITSRYVAELLSRAFDFLVTVDPHLHRYHALSEIYTIPTQVVQTAPLLSAWIKAHVTDPVLIGPDSESEQWVAAVAAAAGAPFTVLEKIRRGDRDVEIQIKDQTMLGPRRPVFVDDMISSGRTMLEAIRQVKTITTASPVCLAIHGLFADRSDELLREAGAQIVTSNTVPHASNDIDVSGLLTACLTKNF